MHWDAAEDEQNRSYVRPWREATAKFTQWFRQENNARARLHKMWADLQLPSYMSRQDVQDQPSTTHKDDTEVDLPVHDQLGHLICICIRHVSRSKYLHHVKADRNPQHLHPDCEDTTDRDAFTAIQKRYYSIRPWWKRLLICARLSLVQYYEVCLIYALFYSSFLIHCLNSF